jgi:predicted AAA+ superfamily ATPase
MTISIDNLIADSQDRPLPTLVSRNVAVPSAPGNALAVLGMRRTGKTWFCFQRMHELLAKGISRDQMLYLNFEDERMLGFSASDFQHLLDAFYRDTCYFFFDEIQNVEGWPQFVRRLLDSSLAEITVTGSSARLLGAEIHTSLRGRALPCEMFPFSFSEYVRAQGFQCPERTPSNRERLELERICRDYLVEGGFPGTLKLDRMTRRQMLQQYLDVVILRDVIERHSVTSVTALRAFVRHILHAPSCRLSVNKIYNDFRSRGLSCSKNGLHAYVDYLADAYLIYMVPIHTRSERVRRVNPRKAYLVDTGLLSAASADITADQGALLENLVFLQLRRSGRIIEYFHASDGSETDFLVRDSLSGKCEQLIQVCWSLESESTRKRELHGLRCAMTELGLTRGTIVTWRDEQDYVEESGVEVVPAWRYLLSHKPITQNS